MKTHIEFRLSRYPTIQKKVCSLAEPGRQLPKNSGEKLLHEIWRSSSIRGTRVRGRDGECYKVIYPGRPSGGMGPDFLDAVIETEGGKRLFGDVEIHVREEDWRSHQHYLNPRYNGVIFHAVLEQGTKRAASLSGKKIPMLLMGSLMGSMIPRNEDTAEEPLTENSYPELPPLFLDLRKAGMERFANMAEGFILESATLGADQAFYASILECLGYSANRKGFRLLSEKVPWKKVERTFLSGGKPEVYSLMWKAAGLASNNSNSRIRASFMDCCIEWNYRGSRPANSPRVRVRGAAILCARMAKAGGSYAYCRSAVEEMKPEEIFRRFCTTQENSIEDRRCIGKGRAQEITVNVVLPGVAADARRRGDVALLERAMYAYRKHPLLPDNSLTREARFLLKAYGLEKPPSGAMEQQGALHYYRLITRRPGTPRQLPMV